MNKEYLADRFGSDEKFGIHSIDDYGNADPNGNRQVLFNGGSAVQGHSYAEAVRDMLPDHNVQIVGFYSKDNPESTYAKQWHEDGADFAIVDNRYLVDPWPKLVLGDKSYPVVYDLHDPADQDKVIETYGDPKKWEHARVTQPDETMVKRALALEYGSDKETSLFLARNHIQAIRNHPVLEKIREAEKLPGMTPSAIETYSNALLRNNPDLSEHISGFRKQMEQIASVGGIKPTEPTFVVIGQAIDQLPANFGKEALFDAIRVATIEPPKATIKP
ncbi:hypothetical protein ACSSZE_03270 [Acidithiobacillus caldus]